MPIQVSTASWVLNGCAHAAVRMQLCACSCAHAAHAAVEMQLAATDALELSQRGSRNDAIRGAAKAQFQKPESRHQTTAALKPAQNHPAGFDWK